MLRLATVLLAGSEAVTSTASFHICGKETATLEFSVLKGPLLVQQPTSAHSLPNNSNRHLLLQSCLHSSVVQALSLFLGVTAVRLRSWAWHEAIVLCKTSCFRCLLYCPFNDESF